MISYILGHKNPTRLCSGWSRIDSHIKQYCTEKSKRVFPKRVNEIKIQSPISTRTTDSNIIHFPSINIQQKPQLLFFSATMETRARHIVGWIAVIGENLSFTREIFIKESVSSQKTLYIVMTMVTHQNRF